MATTNKPATSDVPVKKTAQSDEVVALEVTTIPFDGIPMTQAITEGYAANAKSAADIAALTPAKAEDFKMNITYQTPVRIGVVNTGTVEEPVYEDRYELKLHTVRPWGSPISDLVEFLNAVTYGNAYNVQAAPATTTVAPTTVPV